ncbi:hypothetical protein MNB_ARC-1_1222 [hydrothermal vent metagenome]|uniref:Uncharacterized protein n=1 Tax=hydrothermal vent metagenome TaxID=652676 RepID=A0A3B1E650_9ZZZZ
MIFKTMVILILSSLCFGALNNGDCNNGYQNIDYEPYFFDNSVLSISGAYGFGISYSRKDYFGANILIKTSQYSFIGLELLQMKSKLAGDFASPNNILVGRNTSYMGNMIFGLRLKPHERLTMFPYVGTGANIHYVANSEIGTITSGIDIIYSANSFIAISLGYKNIAILFSPTLELEHYANASLRITF